MTEPTTVRFHTEPAAETQEEVAFWEALADHATALRDFIECGYTEQEAQDTIDQIARDYGRAEWCP